MEKNLSPFSKRVRFYADIFIKEGVRSTEAIAKAVANTQEFSGVKYHYIKNSVFHYVLERHLAINSVSKPSQIPVQVSETGLSANALADMLYVSEKENDELRTKLSLTADERIKQLEQQLITLQEELEDAKSEQTSLMARLDAIARDKVVVGERHLIVDSKFKSKSL